MVAFVAPGIEGTRINTGPDSITKEKKESSAPLFFLSVFLLPQLCSDLTAFSSAPQLFLSFFNSRTNLPLHTWNE